MKTRQTLGLAGLLACVVFAIITRGAWADFVVREVDAALAGIDPQLRQQTRSRDLLPQCELQWTTRFAEHPVMLCRIPRALQQCCPDSYCESVVADRPAY